VDIQEIQALIRDVPDFPKPGIVFKDITPVLANAKGLRACAEHLAIAVRESGAEELVGIESRGFIFGAAVAAVAELPLQLIRKPGKLPHTKVGLDYELEYGKDRVEMHTDAIARGRRYCLIDDLIATGGTAGAAVRLIQGQGGIVSTCAFVIELEFLKGRDKLEGCPVHSMITY
jgi:adenine phosphoribosyltransferase